MPYARYLLVFALGEIVALMLWSLLPRHMAALLVFLGPVSVAALAEGMSRATLRGTMPEYSEVFEFTHIATGIVLGTAIAVVAVLGVLAPDAVAIAFGRHPFQKGAEGMAAAVAIFVQNFIGLRHGAALGLWRTQRRGGGRA